jgi:hypothetical protein
VQRALECDDIDFYSLIHSHFERKGGGIWAHHMAGSSAVLHGRMLYEEDDTATHAAQQELGWQQFCRDARETEGVLSRNLMGGLTCGGSIFWHDFSAEGWFSDDDVATQIGRLVDLFKQEFEKPYTGRSQIVGFVSKDAKSYFRQDSDLTDGVYPRQLSELLHCGAPVDMYYTEDLPLLAEKGMLDRYRTAVFFDAFVVGEEVREAIQTGVACDGRTVIWCYGAGFITPDGFSAEAMSELTGMPVEIGREAQALKAATRYTGELIQYGVNARISPVIQGKEDAPGVNTRGWYVQPESPAFMTREADNWRSIWTGAPALPSAVLRQVLKEAGVHLYSEVGDPAFAVNDLMAVHATFDGPREIYLPQEARVTDALTGETVSDACRQFTWNARRADTGIWRLGRSAPDPLCASGTRTSRRRK